MPLEKRSVTKTTQTNKAKESQNKVKAKTRKKCRKQDKYKKNIEAMEKRRIKAEGIKSDKREAPRRTIDQTPKEKEEETKII